jgi:hypothetical protein
MLATGHARVGHGTGRGGGTRTDRDRRQSRVRAAQLAGGTFRRG